MQSSERSILAVSCFGHFLCHYNMLSFTPLVLPLTLTMHLELAEVLELAGMMYSLFGLSALLWGPLADRLGARILFATYFAGAGLCGLGAAFYVDDPFMFKWCLAGIGFFTGVHHPVGLGLITKGLKRVAVGMGYHGMAGNVGLAVGPFATGLLNWAVGAQGAYLALALMNLGGLIMLMRFKMPEESQIEHKGDVEAAPKALSPFLLMILILIMGGMIYRMATVIMPALFELRAQGFFAALGLDKGFDSTWLASTTASVMYTIGIGAQYLGGWIGERYDKRYAYMTFYLIATPVALASYWMTGGALILISILLMCIMVGYQPIENTLYGVITPPNLRYSAFGVKCACTFGVGGIAVWLAGAVEKGHGIQAVLPTVGLITLAAGICMVGFIILTTKIYNKRAAAAA